MDSVIWTMRGQTAWWVPSKPLSHSLAFRAHYSWCSDSLGSNREQLEGGINRRFSLWNGLAKGDSVSLVDNRGRQ